MIGKNNRQGFNRFLAAASLIMVLAGCARLHPVAPEVSLVDLQLSELSLSHAIMLANLKIFNPNDFSVDVENVGFSLSLNGISVAEGRSARDVRIPAESSGQMTLRLASAYLDLLQLSNRLQEGERVDYLLSGEVRLGGPGVWSQTFPIRREGVIPLVPEKPSSPSGN